MAEQNCRRRTTLSMSDSATDLDSPETTRQVMTYLGTVQACLSKHERRWVTRKMKNVERRGALAGTGRAGFVAKYPTIVDKVKAQLIGLRASGISVSRVLGRAIFIAVIEEHYPRFL